jgi:hypothetical protein
MQQIAVDRYGPKAFILAPDGEFTSFDPENDQVWGLSLDVSDTSPFHLYTTYHLRAKSMRLFNNIIVGQQRLTRLEDFSRLPTVTGYTPSTLKIEYAFSNLVQVCFACFIPEPDILVGSVRLHNAGSQTITLEYEFVAILNPMAKGHPTHPERINGNQVLIGQTDQLFPVLFMSGGPQGTSNPYPALHAPLQLEPGASEELHWALASKASQDASLKAARELASPVWLRASQVQSKAFSRQTVFIKTGNPDWDSAFYLSQVNALTHLVRSHGEGHHSSFIHSRLPDQPHALHFDSQGISDLTLLDALHLTQMLLPTHVDHLAMLVENFVNQVDTDGSLPSQVLRGFAGKTVNECPLLANLCLLLYEINEDLDFLARVYPNLQRFIDTGWLSEVKPDLACLPNWQTPAQLQLETGLFAFDAWTETGNGLNIHTADSPAMAAMLYREVLALKKIAHILGDRSARNTYAKIIKRLSEIIHSLWNEETHTFTYQDRDTHQSPLRELYYPGRVQPILEINKQFNQPQRLHLKLILLGERPGACALKITGQNAAGDPIDELFQAPELRCVTGHAHLTTRQVYARLDSITFEGFDPEDRFLIETADYQQIDITCLLPIWTGVIHADHLQALHEAHLDSRAPGLSAGIPETWRNSHPLPEGLRPMINIQWNTLIISGLIGQGHPQEAMQLFTNMMYTIIQALKDYNGFFSSYDLESGMPQGQANAIPGLAPMRLCLEIAGIKLISPDRVAIWGSNPFPWPIEVRWQGLWLCREGSQTHIIFPDGTQYQSQATKPLVLASSRG